MAFHAYLKLTGQKQGVIKGGSTQRPGKSDGWHGVVGFGYTVQAPHDVNIGQPTGKRTHKPFVVTKEVSATSPQLLQALATNEVFKSVEIELVDKGLGGLERTVSKIELKDAVVSGRIERRAASGGREVSAARGTQVDVITFAYESISIIGSHTQWPA